MTKEQKEKINKIIEAPSEVMWQEELKKHTSFKIGGPAECYIIVKTIEALKEILKYAKQENISITIIGNGSNILALDNGVKGIVLEINITKFEIEGTTVTVGAGNKLIPVAYELAKNNLAGFEELSGIPGTIGGAIYMNAGAHGKEIKDFIKTIKCIDLKTGNEKELTKEQAQFEYRKSIFSNKENIIVEATMELEKGNTEEIKNKMQELLKVRKEKQPLEYPSAGSTFKRGDDFITAVLIDQCGLKGYNIGDAEVSTKHAGFIINKGNATAKDVIELVEYIKKKVYEKFEKEIELEVQIIGEK